MPFKDPQKKLEYQRMMRKANAERYRAYERKSYGKKSKESLKRKNMQSLAWHNAHPEVRNKANKKWRIKRAAMRPKKEPKIKIGDTFGKLIVIGIGPSYKNGGGPNYICLCECGEKTNSNGNRLLKGTKSCGCQPTKYIVEKRRKAGFPDDFLMTPFNKAQRVKFSTSLSTKVRKRDQYTCQLCLQKASSLHVHHIKTWRDSPELRFDERNLVTLCRDCHLNKVHGGVFSAPVNKKLSAKLLNIVSAKY